MINDVKHFQCDKCGTDIFINPLRVDDIVMANQCWSIDLGKAGYGSYFDGLKIKFDLCDFCLCQFINSFKYNRITEHDIKNL